MLHFGVMSRCLPEKAAEVSQTKNWNATRQSRYFFKNKIVITDFHHYQHTLDTLLCLILNRCEIKLAQNDLPTKLRVIGFV